jgi:hypothetical protein
MKVLADAGVPRSEPRRMVQFRAYTDLYDAL